MNVTLCTVGVFSINKKNTRSPLYIKVYPTIKQCIKPRSINFVSNRKQWNSIHTDAARRNIYTKHTVISYRNICHHTSNNNYLIGVKSYILQHYIHIFVRLSKNSWRIFFDLFSCMPLEIKILNIKLHVSMKIKLQMLYLFCSKRWVQDFLVYTVLSLLAIYIVFDVYRHSEDNCCRKLVLF